MHEKIKIEKRRWQKPELIVLVRSKPEEAVLTNCKTASGATGTGGVYEACGTGVSVNCTVGCNVIVSS